MVCSLTLFMKSPNPLPLLAGGLCALLGWGAITSTAPLQAAAGTYGLWADTDQDGLDDALETRFGLSHLLSDTDGDGYSDFDEVMAGFDPLDPGGLNQMMGVDPKLTLEVYTIGADTVLTVTFMRRYTVRNLQLMFATQDSLRTVNRMALAALPNDTRNIQTGIPGMMATVSRVTIPTALLDNVDACALAVHGELDGTRHGSEVSLTTVEGVRMEYRTELSMSRGDSHESQGGQQGGLFPTDGDDILPGEVTPGMVCVQELNEVGSLGLGSAQKIYQVSNGYCDMLPTAKCFASCSNTIGGTIIGIDIASLIAN